jgi:hypothetical protein
MGCSAGLEITCRIWFFIEWLVKWRDRVKSLACVSRMTWPEERGAAPTNDRCASSAQRKASPYGDPMLN